MPLPAFIACCDKETFYDSTGYSLKKLATTDYIRSPEFEAQTCAIKVFPFDADPDAYESSSYAGHEDIRAALHRIDWVNTAFLGHHTAFDGLIATHHFGIKPAMWLDTMSMARAVFGVDQSVSLLALCERLGRTAKVHDGALKAVDGLRLSEMSDELIEKLAEYNEDDCNDTAWLWYKLKKFVPVDELRVIDLTLRMYCEPILLIDGERVARVHREEKKRKTELFERIGADPVSIRKNDFFAQALRSLNVEPPMKTNAKGKIIPAFAKTDFAFKELLEHGDERVQWLVEARLGSKSSLVESRSATIMKRVGLPTPIYLNYYGARTGRWSGGDACNWQNLPRKGLGAELRKSLIAPPGHMLIISDAAQIEARLLAWFSGQANIVEAFRTHQDVYCINASGIYGRTITKDDKDERFVGKTFTLGAGYGAGAKKINYMLKIGQFGPPVYQTMEETERATQAWRTANSDIVKKWYRLRDEATTAFMNLTTVEDGPICFEGTRRGGYVHLPNGAYIFYPNVHWDEDENQMAYIARNGTVHLWHGIIMENDIQALARVALSEQMLIMTDEMPDLRIATTTHDEVLCVVPERKAEDYAANVLRIMSTPAPWAPGLPLNADTQISRIYEKA